MYLIDELLIGGTETQLVLLTRKLPKELFEPIIGVLHRTDRIELHADVPIVYFGCTGIPGLRNVSLLLKLKKYLEKEKIDILQSQFSESTIYGSWAVRLKRNRPILISTRRDLYHWINDEPWAFRAMRHTVGWTDRILVNSHSALKECQRVEHVPIEKLMMIQNAVEIGDFDGISSIEAKKTIGLENKFPVIGVLANFRPVKGLCSFVEAAARVYREIPNAHFVFVGRGPQEQELRALSNSLGIEKKVHFLVDYHDIKTAIMAFDIGVQSSLSESLSNVLLEYMAAARPIVATRVGDAERVIQDGDNGLLVHPNDPEAISQAILRLVRDYGAALEMGKRARKKVEENWLPSMIVDNYVKFYLELIELRALRNG